MEQRQSEEIYRSPAAEGLGVLEYWVEEALRALDGMCRADSKDRSLLGHGHAPFR